MNKKNFSGVFLDFPILVAIDFINFMSYFISQQSFSTFSWTFTDAKNIRNKFISHLYKSGKLTT